MTAWIPYGCAWSSPFCKWQGSFAHLHAFELAARVTRAALNRRGIDPKAIEAGVLGTTVPQRGSFYGLPFLAGRIGAPHLAGPTVAQACATGARAIVMAADEVARGARSVLCVTTDRVSNGPHIYYPDPTAPGGTGETENWVLDNFAKDPFAGFAMIETAEKVASKYGVDRAMQDALTLRRFEQYLAADPEFRARTLEAPVDTSVGRKKRPEVSQDEGVSAAEPARVAALKPVLEGGTVTFAGQTHPADGAAGMIVASRERARELSADPVVEIEIVASGQARAEIAHMPEAPIPAARQALDRAGIGIGDVAAVKTHNPFVVNDWVFAKAFGLDPFIRMNEFGSSLVFGHPQGPTGMRLIVELIEELRRKGGGYGLFAGCAAGDTAMALAIRVGRV